MALFLSYEDTPTSSEVAFRERAKLLSDMRDVATSIWNSDRRNGAYDNKSEKSRKVFAAPVKRVSVRSAGKNYGYIFVGDIKTRRQLNFNFN